MCRFGFIKYETFIIELYYRKSKHCNENNTLAIHYKVNVKQIWILLFDCFIFSDWYYVSHRHSRSLSLWKRESYNWVYSARLKGGGDARLKMTRHLMERSRRRMQSTYEKLFDVKWHLSASFSATMEADTMSTVKWTSLRIAFI